MNELLRGSFPSGRAAFRRISRKRGPFGRSTGGRGRWGGGWEELNFIRLNRGVESITLPEEQSVTRNIRHPAGKLQCAVCSSLYEWMRLYTRFIT